jgi:hypothetical protein
LRVSVTALRVPPGATLETTWNDSAVSAYPRAEADTLMESVDVSGISRLNCPAAFVSVSLET